ncbi:MAG: RNA polymerase sigma factor [Thermoanaerobaculia bacterium]
MRSGRFPTTRSSVVLALGSDDLPARTRAFDTVVALYWKPLYKSLRFKGTVSTEDAEDLTQSFFVAALEKTALASFDASKASFRTFLRMLFDRHVANEWKARARLKRGGGATKLDFDGAEAELARDATATITPEEYFEREWARSVFATAVDRLRAWSASNGKEMQVAIFTAYDLDGDRDVSYRELAQRFGVPETTVTNHLAAARRQFRAILLELIGEVTASDREYRAEVRALLGKDAM